MFTGIVAALGTATNVVETETGRRIRIADEAIFDDMAVGDSVAVNGVCLTAVAVGDGEVTVDVVMESLERSNLGEVESGGLVNLERPMAASGRFDGHIVQGHVDGVGRVERLQAEGESIRMWISIPDPLTRYIVEKGSVTVDGVSLTIAGVSEDGFEVALIPHTLAVTVLGERKPGDQVNLEADIIAKYVERLLGKRQ